MRSRAIFAAVIVLAGCVAPPPAPAPEPPKLTGKETNGEKVLMAQQYCVALASHECPAGGTLYCDAFRRSYVKNCMVRAGVPPEYILVLQP